MHHLVLRHQNFAQGKGISISLIFTPLEGQLSQKFRDSPNMQAHTDNSHRSSTMATIIMQKEDPSPLPLRILHLEDSAIDHELVRLALHKSGERCELVRVETLEEFSQMVHSREFDVILADYRLPGFTALDAWQCLQQQAHYPPFILLSGAIGEPAAVSAIKMGISDYLAKDDLSRLAQIIRRSVEVHNIRQAKEKADVELALSERRLADFSEHLQMTIEQERASIAREIHDDIGGALAAVKFDISWIGRHSVDPATLGHVTAATEMLQHALEASQRIMMNLRPAILDQGLTAAVQWLAAGFAKRTGIETVVHARLQLALSKEIQLVAYRTAQEALTNVSKYAECALVTIDLSDAENVLTLEVTDNGKGMLPTELAKPKAFGIRGLHERAKTVGGWLDVSTLANKGTSITLSVPLSSCSVKETD
jgi:two-component system sensor histidine kinase UhpB